MFPQFSPSGAAVGVGQPPVSSMVSQSNNLLGRNPFATPQSGMDFNSTAPSSSMAPGVANMVKALQGGQ